MMPSPEPVPPRVLAALRKHYPYTTDKGIPVPLRSLAKTFLNARHVPVTDLDKITPDTLNHYLEAER